MRKLVIGSLVALALAGGAVAFAAGPDGPGFPHMPFMHEEPAFMLDAKLAGMKAALKLTPDQEKAWAPFETAVRDGDSARRDGWKAARARMESDQRPNPIEGLNFMSEGLGKASAEVKKVADAAKPLYDGLNEDQKHRFGPLLMSLAPHHGGPMGMGMGPMGHHPHGGEPL